MNFRNNDEFIKRLRRLHDNFYIAQKTAKLKYILLTDIDICDFFLSYKRDKHKIQESTFAGGGWVARGVGKEVV